MTLAPDTVRTLTLPPGDAADEARVRAWRAAGVPEDIVAVCAAARRTDRIAASVRGRHGHAFVAALPRSGGDWLAAALARAGGLAPVPLAADETDDEPALAPWRVPAFAAGSSVAQHPVRATIATVDLLARLGVRPVVLVRNAEEILGLVARDLDGTDDAPAFAHVPPDVGAWTLRDRLDLVVRALGPRLLGFVASWDDAAECLPVLRLRHAALVADPAGSVRAALAHARIPADDARIEAAVTELGPPPVGPDAPALPAPLRAALGALASFYADDHDLTDIGL